MVQDFFKHLKVVDISSVLAGPLTGSFFAETGAQVIKIENKNTAGDVTRQWKLPEEAPDCKYSAYYGAANYGKKTLLLDLQEETQRARLEDLISNADIVISNFQKKTAEKLQLTPELITSRYPDIIFAQLSAYDYEDPRPGYDLVMQAETGYISMTGTSDGHLCKMPVAIIDILAAHQMKEAILLALLQKMRTGKGCTVHVSLYKSALTGLVNQASNFLMCNHIPKPLGTLHPNIAPYGDLFKSEDGITFMLAIGSDSQFEKLWKTLNFDSHDYPNFNKNLIRLRNRSRLQSVLQSEFSLIPYSKIESTLKENNLPYCKIANLEEVFSRYESIRMVNEELTDDNFRLRSVSSIAFGLKVP